MALVNTILIDLAGSTASLTTTSGGNLVETITFASNQMTFSLRADIIISGSDFLTFIQQVNLFQAAVIKNFTVNLITSLPFGECDITNAHDSGANTWNLILNYVALTHPTINYLSTLSGKTVELITRSSSKTLTFPEWIYCIQQLNQYYLQIQSYFSL